MEFLEKCFNKLSELTKIQGKLTSQIRQRGEKESYYYAFIKLKGQGADLPVIFRTDEENKPNLVIIPISQLSCFLFTIIRNFSE